MRADPAIAILRGAFAEMQQSRLVSPGLEVAGKQDKPPAAPPSVSFAGVSGH